MTEPSAAPLVTTAAGTLSGVRLDSGVHAFLGVPYAAPPVGPRRFAPPAPLEPWGGIRPAHQHGPAPIQGGGSPGRVLLDLSVPVQSEDCLNLCVWTPTLDRSARLPVLVWLHGGAFLTGANSVPAYDGARLAARGVVVVSVNYRLGLFGWLRHRSLGADGNQGLDDQLAALQWVQREAAGFGGDVDNVTVFGNSAGGGSIAAHLAAAGPHTRLFRRVVLQSGAYNLIGTVDEAEATVERLERHLGTDPATWRELPTEVLRQAQDTATPRAAGVFYRPVADGARLPAEPAAQLARSAPPVTMLIGSNAREYGFFWGRDERFDTMGDDQLRAVIGRWHPEPDEVIDRYRRARAERGEASDNRTIGITAAGDVNFRVPSMALAAWHSTRAATFAYRFDWSSPLFDGLIGAAHVLEVPFVFGTHDHPTVAAFTGFDVEPERVAALAEEVGSAWVRFAGAGDPGWPRYDPTGRTTRIFDAPSRIENDPAGAERACWDPTALPR